MQSWGGVNLQLEAEPVAAWNWRLGIPLSLAALLNTKFLAAPGDKMLCFQSAFAKPVCCFVCITNSPKSVVSALVDSFHSGIQGG